VPDGVEDDCPICTLISAQVDKLGQAEARVTRLAEALREYADGCVIEARKYHAPVPGLNGPSPTPYDCYGYNVLTRIARQVRDIAGEEQHP